MSDLQGSPLLPVPAPHPLEKMPGATARVTLPMSGIECLVRRVGFKAVVTGGMMHALQTGALTAAAFSFASEAKEHLQDGTLERPTVELEALEALRMQRISRMAVLRNALLSPTLDKLLAVYGGSEDWDDLGLGPDYDALDVAIQALNPAGGEPAMTQARTFPPSERRDPERARGKVRKAPQ